MTVEKLPSARVLCLLCREATAGPHHLPLEERPWAAREVRRVDEQAKSFCGNDSTNPICKYILKKRVPKVSVIQSLKVI